LKYARHKEKKPEKEEDLAKIRFLKKTIKVK